MAPSLWVPITLEEAACVETKIGGTQRLLESSYALQRVIEAILTKLLVRDFLELLPTHRVVTCSASCSTPER